MLRLPKRPASDHSDVDPLRLLAAQQLHRGTAASLLVAALAITAWIYLAMLFDRYFPWVSMLQGILIGLAMRRFGRGVDWRFPLVAAALTMIAAVAGSFLVALFLTGREFGTGAWQLVNEISTHTVATFLVREFGTIGVIYMAFAAVLAAFYANRRLQRREAIALRRHRDASNGGSLRT